MSYSIITIKYICDACGKETILPFLGEYLAHPNTPEINCPKGWKWHSLSEHSANRHYCEDCKIKE